MPASKTLNSQMMEKEKRFMIHLSQISFPFPQEIFKKHSATFV